VDGKQTKTIKYPMVGELASEEWGRMRAWSHADHDTRVANESDDERTGHLSSRKPHDPVFSECIAALVIAVIGEEET
jgi:hypothetical protein